MITDIKIPNKIWKNSDLSLLKLNIITADKTVNIPKNNGVELNLSKWMTISVEE